MHIEIRPAKLPQSLPLLMKLDRSIFPPKEKISKKVWSHCDNHIFFYSKKPIGAIAFMKHHDIIKDGHQTIPRPGSLCIISTGILPKFRNKGFGKLLKAWEVAYAKDNGFHTVVSGTRKSNSRMIQLNKKFGFQITKTIPDYYQAPQEPAVVMKLVLKQAKK